MVKVAKIGISVYLVFILYVISNSQAHRASGKYTPDKTEPAKLANLNVIPAAKLPANWSERMIAPGFYRAALISRTKTLIDLPSGTSEALKKADRLAARQSVISVDDVLIGITNQADLAHSTGNQKIRKVRMGARGVPIHASNRGYGSSSHK